MRLGITMSRRTIASSPGRRQVVPLLCGLSIFATVDAAPVGHYVIDDIQVITLGTLGGAESVAHDINNQGQIVGWALDSGGKQRAFIYRGFGMEFLVPGSAAISTAFGINNLSRVVGEFSVPPSTITHAFYWQGALFYPLNEAAPPDDAPYCGTGSSASAINDSGVIVGIRQIGCNPPVPVADKAVGWGSYVSSWQDLLIIHAPADYYAHDVNNSGVIAGNERHGYYSDTGAYLWEAGAVNDVPYPLATPPQWFSPSYMRALGINDYGWVVGDALLKPQGLGTDDTVTRAYVWNGVSAQSRQLPGFSNTRNSVAYDINNHGFSVGYADEVMAFIHVNRKHAALWHSHIGIVELPLPSGAAPGGLLAPNYCEAYAIGDRKAGGLMQAVGYCRIAGKRKAVRWNILTSYVIPPDPSPARH